MASNPAEKIEYAYTEVTNTEIMINGINNQALFKRS